MRASQRTPLRRLPSSASSPIPSSRSPSSRSPSPSSRGRGTSNLTPRQIRRAEEKARAKALKAAAARRHASLSPPGSPRRSSPRRYSPPKRAQELIEPWDYRITMPPPPLSPDERKRRIARDWRESLAMRSFVEGAATRKSPQNATAAAPASAAVLSIAQRLASKARAAAAQARADKEEALVRAPNEAGKAAAALAASSALLSVEALRALQKERIASREAITGELMVASSSSGGGASAAAESSSGGSTGTNTGGGGSNTSTSLLKRSLGEAIEARGQSVDELFKGARVLVLSRSLFLRTSLSPLMAS